MQDNTSAKRKATFENNTNNANKKSKIDTNQIPAQQYQDSLDVNTCLLCNSKIVVVENLRQSVEYALIKWHYTQCLFEQGAFSQLDQRVELYSSSSSSSSSCTQVYQCYYTEHGQEYKDYKRFCWHLGYSHGVTEKLLRAKQPNIPHIENLLVQLYPEHQPDDLTWQDADLLKTHETCVLCRSTSTPEKCLIEHYPQFYPPKTTWGDLTGDYQCIYQNCHLSQPMNYEWFCIHVATSHLFK